MQVRPRGGGLHPVAPSALFAALQSVYAGAMPSAFVPDVVGSITAFAGPPEKIPDNWIPCDGRSLKQSEFKKLFRVIGLRYSGPDHAAVPITDGMFRVPNLCGRVILGEGHGSGLTNRRLADTGGKESQNISATSNAAPTIAFFAQKDQPAEWSRYVNALPHSHDVSASVPTLPPFMGLIYIIYTQSYRTVDVADVRPAGDED